MRTLPTQQVTIESIAALTGVSRSTGSRVLNNHPHVRAEVRERIERVIAEHGYTPHAAVRQPFYEMGRALTETLLTQVEQGRQRPEVQRVFPVELVVRASCGAARPESTAVTGVASSRHVGSSTDESAESPRHTALHGDTA